MKKVLLWVLGILVVLIIIANIGGKDENNRTETGAHSPPSSPSGEAPQADAVAEAAIKVTPDELVSAYSENEIAANKQYKDKKLEVTGKLESISAGIGDEPYLVLKTGKQFDMDRPQAHLAKSDQGKAADLKKGQTITLICVGGGEVMGTPMLSDCVIQP